jgi:hypothetical protein
VTQAALFPTREPRAVFSPCTKHDRPCAEACTGRIYRFRLYWPTGLANDRVVLWVLANPSSASATDTDPTVRRCIGYARQWGFGWASIGNVRAWRETDPDLVPRDSTAIGPENEWHLIDMMRGAELIVMGFGKLGGEHGRSVVELVRASGKVPCALKLNEDGSPQHPLYLRATLRPFPMVAQ